MSWQQRSVWVIGASSGIGAAVAKQLVQQGAKVTISARRKSDLETVANGQMNVREVDIQDLTTLQKVAQELHAAGELDLVLVAAGYWKQDEPKTFDLESFKRHIEVNLIGVGNVVSSVLPLMQSQNKGQFALVSSVAGYRGLPGSLGYGSTKAAQLHLMEALRGTFNGTGIWFQTISPGFVETPMTSTNQFPMPFLISAEKAARFIVRGLASKRPEIVFPLPMAIAMRITKFVPQRLWIRLVGKRG